MDFLVTSSMSRCAGGLPQDDVDGEPRPSLPRAVVAVSATEGSGVAALNKELSDLLQ